MARNKLIQTCANNSEKVAESFVEVNRVGAKGTQLRPVTIIRPDYEDGDDVRDNEFARMMQGNRGVL